MVLLLQRQVALLPLLALVLVPMLVAQLLVQQARMVLLLQHQAAPLLLLALVLVPTLVAQSLVQARMVLPPVLMPQLPTRLLVLMPRLLTRLLVLMPRLLTRLLVPTLVVPMQQYVKTRSFYPVLLEDVPDKGSKPGAIADKIAHKLAAG